MDASDDLHHRYRRLRQQLDAAYAAPDWDSSHIDRITEQMVPIERALSSRSSHDRPRPVDGDASHAAA